MRRRAIVGTAVVAGGVAHAHHMNKQDAENQAAAEQQDLREQQALDAQAAQQQVAPPSAGLTSSGMDELTKLAGLRDQGILSEEEFAAQKAKILG